MTPTEQRLADKMTPSQIENSAQNYRANPDGFSDWFTEVYGGLFSAPGEPIHNEDTSIPYWSCDPGGRLHDIEISDMISALTTYFDETVNPEED